MEKKCAAVNSQAFSATARELAQEKSFAADSKALSHPARVRILKILVALDKAGGCLNSDLVSDLGLAQSTVSEHLRILKQATFIIAEPMPPKMCYRVNHSKIAAYTGMFSEVVLRT